MTDANVIVPADFPVQPIDPSSPAISAATCGTCGLTWDDGISTSWTPAPSGRCPFEYFHVDEDDDDIEQTYEIVRFRFMGESEVLESGVTLEEAQEHCEREDTRGDGWFDGWRAE